MAQKYPTIAITGANGFLGSKLVEHFSAQGWSIIGLVRNGKGKASLPGVTYKAYDISKAIEPEMLRGVDYLVHAAYVKFDAERPNAMDVNITGAAHLLEASRKSKVKRNIFISTMSAHDEATSMYGRQKMEIEKLFSSTADSILKCGLIIGNGGIVKEMAAFMQSKHAVPLIGGGKQPLQIVAIDDLVKVIEQVLTKNLSGTFVVATPEVYSYKAFYHALSRRLNTFVLYIPIPYIALQIMFRVASKLGIKLGVGEDNLEGLKMLRAMDSSGHLKKIGVELKSLDKALSSSDL